MWSVDAPTRDIINEWKDLKKSQVLKSIFCGELVDDSEMDNITTAIHNIKAAKLVGRKAWLKASVPAINSELARLQSEQERLALTVECNNSLSSIKELTEAQLMNIPTQVHGNTPEFVARQRQILHRYAHCFDRQLRKECADVPPMELIVDESGES